MNKRNFLSKSYRTGWGGRGGGMISSVFHQMPSLGKCEVCQKDYFVIPNTCQICGKQICSRCTLSLVSLQEGGITGSTVGPSSQSELLMCRSCADILKLSLRVKAGMKEEE